MPFTFSVYSGLLLPFFVQGVVVSGVLLGRSRRLGTAADAWLALLLVLHTLRLAQWMLGFAGWYDSHDAFSTFMFYFPFSNWLAVGPALYFYFRSLTNQEFRFEQRHWWHFAPVLLLLAGHLVVFLYDVAWWYGLRGQPLPAHFGTKGPWAAALDQLPLHYVVDVASYLSIGIYAGRTLREYRAYARYLNDNFSDTDQIRFRWLRNVLVAVLIGTGVTLGFGVINSFVTPLSYYQAWYDYLFTGLLIYYLSIAGLLTGHQLAGLRFQPTTESLAPEPEPDSEPDTLYEPELVPEPELPILAGAAPEPAVSAAMAAQTPAAPEAEAELTRWTARLLTHMQTARPYLAPELTLGELAAQLRTNTSWLSRVINTGCGQNFNDFINEYRVREAEVRLQNPRFRHYTLLAVALDAGFNSKSTFNRVFKKLRGTTPGEVPRPK
ncbi:helix-turn-helix domain-containing protein [Hymenobacter chitinivorans]|uniref:AraC-like DNA-binding protein n=1 Tax=Hymenobacter chitinivorans DSM 11115 TaxID=1121954 RepID=A0A2M9BNY6_9BACT|nr:helix-turn-helix domain-containing protein [Hymenobacter chitinivorans]PJJ59664.1 AraC-like DNA-binding protein [Hymenobacter chitinivorans DSM 11115]